MEYNSREMPNTKFSSFYGKPIFEPTYGHKNTHFQYGGLLYGDYMLSHNVNPHRGSNKPEFQQTYNNAIGGSFFYPPNFSISKFHQRGVAAHENFEEGTVIYTYIYL